MCRHAIKVSHIELQNHVSRLSSGIAWVWLRRQVVWVFCDLSTGSVGKTERFTTTACAGWAATKPSRLSMTRCDGPWCTGAVTRRYQRDKRHSCHTTLSWNGITLARHQCMPMTCMREPIIRFGYLGRGDFCPVYFQLYFHAFAVSFTQSLNEHCTPQTCLNLRPDKEGGGGALESLPPIFPDCQKTATLLADIFGTPYHASFPHRLYKIRDPGHARSGHQATSSDLTT